MEWSNIVRYTDVRRPSYVHVQCVPINIAENSVVSIRYSLINLTSSVYYNKT